MAKLIDVGVYDLEGNYLETILQTNSKDLFELFNIDYSGVMNLLSAGSKYQFKKLFKGKALKQVGDISNVLNTQINKVHKYYNGRYICTYNNMTQAAEKNNLEISGISRAISGEFSKVGVYEFKNKVYE